MNDQVVDVGYLLYGGERKPNFVVVCFGFFKMFLEKGWRICLHVNI
jgi:hypothetical protein